MPTLPSTNIVSFRIPQGRQYRFVELYAVFCANNNGELGKNCSLARYRLLPTASAHTPRTFHNCSTAKSLIRKSSWFSVSMFGIR
jgi:hypothetical protein